jgi:beta-lactamase superfamily II metal-dependent hydrolase
MNPVTSIKVRMYNTGSVGDCLLLLFYKGTEISYRMLIDCGGFNTTAKLITPCVEDIHKICKGELDLLVVTHQHLDHISGFNQARHVFDKITVKQVWMSWIEDKTDPIGKILRERYEKKVDELTLTAQKAVKQLKAMGSKTYSVAGMKKRFGKKSDRMMNTLHLLEFEKGLSHGKGLAAGKQTNEQAMEYVKQKAPISYWRPGQVIKEQEGAEGIRFFILGPPRDADMKFFKIALKDEEMYHLAAASPTLETDPEKSDPILDSGIILQRNCSPFGDQYQLKGADKKNFEKKYKHPDMAWRQIETDWLEASASLALRVNNLTNNTSLAMALEFADSGKVLLLPGDAQSGNWMSWHKPDVMKALKTNGGKDTVDLLTNTIFYKVGHHGSHNGTASLSGLEHMKSRDLVACMPLVQNKVPDEWGGSKNFPAGPLYKMLLEKTRGRLIRTDQGIATSAKAKQLRNQLTATELNGFQKAFSNGSCFVEYTIKG